MTASEKGRYGILVGKGYFPEELPPCFTSEDLEAIVKKANFNIGNYSRNPDDKELLKFSKLIPFSIPHLRGYRRMLSIPGPFHYTQLAHTLVINRNAISSIITASEMSVFRDYDAALTSARYISKPDFKALTEQRILKATGYRYLLVVDISRFYASIYTHSIPWAIHTKAVAKANDRFTLYGNMVDLHTRQCQDRQTMGLPVGPDSSRIISEIILATVDKGLQETLSDFKGIRNVDDYYLYFKTYADAERGKTLLQKLLREYELELNLAKEKIIELPEIMESEWKSAIRRFRFRRKAEHERSDLIMFFDMNFSFAKKYPDDMILTYAIAKLRGLSVHRSNWKIFEAFLLNAIVLEPKVVQQVIYVFLINRERGVRIDWPKVQGAIEAFMLFHAEHDHHFELVWSLWFFLKCEIELSAEAVKGLNASNNDLVILLLLELERKNLLGKPLIKRTWRQLITKENLVSEHWLLAYESGAGHYLGTDTSHIEEVEYFAMLLEKRVRFFKPDDEAQEDEHVIEPKSSLAKELESHENRDDDDDDIEDV
ncbi:RNA-directed DNA polymerase [Mucilaginibacter sp.]|jgi:hypothetical protein|uniref:RNA-directed DNA polymerase n=1 Tax=Mucilaginibacter sp. TaxID=1882438 RepID=UPI002C1C76E5|nr:RNA-directed DNA polymerase [Mucilaginibacter sp.]HTI60104.1 RNA-directed DNA polymerase [Mucilaginibacter sp.]